MNRVRRPAFVTAGSSTTSLSRLARVAMVVPLCLLPAFFAYQAVRNVGDLGFVLCLVGVIFFGAPLILILPALRHRPDHTGPGEVAQRRHDRAMSEALAHQPTASPATIGASSRPTPPTRW